jgi:cell fate regulator YaaT (PSP1 superfamily)
MKIAGVRFRDNWRVYDFDATDIEVSIGNDVIVESDRGLGFARVVRLREGENLPETPPSAQEPQKGREGGRKEPEPQEEEGEIEIEVETPGDIAAAAAAAAAGQPATEQSADRPAERPKQPKGYRKVLRKATEDDLHRVEKNRVREGEAYKVCQDLIAERDLPMKLIRAEFSFDASRVTFFFFSETRVDFRELVKELAHRLRSRIEMRQVGVRDVARMIGGFGPCGRELCCTSFLRTFEPVSIRMAKKQEMVLNPAKISGVCGRLLCCLSYEYAMYDEIKKDLVQMKDAVVQEKREAEERRLAEERREAEERRLAEQQRREEEEKRRQEQRQRERQRQQEQKVQKDEKKQDEKKTEGPQERKPHPAREQRHRDKQQAKQPPRPDQPQAAAEQQPAGEKTEGKSKRRRRFWRKKKKKGGGGPEGGAPQPGGSTGQG